MPALGARVVEQHEYGYLRVVRRGEADEGDDVFLLAGDLLCGLGGGAGLAADAVARDVGVVARALLLVADDLLEYGAHGGAGLLANDLPHELGLGLGDDVPVRILDALHEVGLHEIPAVNAGGDGGYELDGRYVEGLSEGGRRELGEVLRVAEHVLAPPDAAALAAEGLCPVLAVSCWEVSAVRSMKPKPSAYS